VGRFRTVSSLTSLSGGWIVCGRGLKCALAATWGARRDCWRQGSESPAIRNVVDGPSEGPIQG
jgi:hypothetical protein